MSKTLRKAGRVAFALAAVAFLLSLAPTAAAAAPNPYTVTPLVSNNGVPGTTVDASLVNAWGLVAGPTTPWWVADNGADTSTLYTAAGAKIAGIHPTVAGAPTGVVFNGDTESFLVGSPGSAARFIFATESGLIQGWTIGFTAAEVHVDDSGLGAIYKGLAVATTASGPMLYATDFANSRVDVVDRAWAPVTVAGGFADPSLPAGYAPFGIQTIGDRIFVTYAKQGVPEDGGLDELHGQGLGFVDAFDTAGHFLVRVAQRGQLNAPWGLAWAPADFGRFGGDLLVGNFGDGHINAYEEQANGHFAFRGTLSVAEDVPIVIDGLWALQFGHGSASNGPTNTLFFTAGPNDEADGLFGSITAG